MKRSEIEALADLMFAELRKPGDVQKVFAEAERRVDEARPLVDFFISKDRQHRTTFYLESQRTWFRGFGWTMARALMLFSVAAAGIFALGGGRVTPDQLGTFIFGASAFYVFLYMLSLRRIGKEEKKIAGILEVYRAEVRAILDELITTHKLDAEKYKA